jgi:hypothetical protein
MVMLEEWTVVTWMETPEILLGGRGNSAMLWKA